MKKFLCLAACAGLLASGAAFAATAPNVTYITTMSNQGSHWAFTDPDAAEGWTLSNAYTMKKGLGVVKDVYASYDATTRTLQYRLFIEGVNDEQLVETTSTVTQLNPTGEGQWKSSGNSLYQCGPAVTTACPVPQVSI